MSWATADRARRRWPHGLAEALDADLVELDALNWEPGWVALNESDPEELERRFRAATGGERWMTAGSYTRLCQRAFWPRLDSHRVARSAVANLCLAAPAAYLAALAYAGAAVGDELRAAGSQTEDLAPGQPAGMDRDATCPQAERHACPPGRSQVDPHPLRTVDLCPRSGGLRRRGGRTLVVRRSATEREAISQVKRKTILVLDAMGVMYPARGRCRGPADTVCTDQGMRQERRGDHAALSRCFPGQHRLGDALGAPGIRRGHCYSGPGDSGGIHRHRRPWRRAPLVRRCGD